MSKIQLGVMFGSRSCEHEVSIISAVQLMRAADRQIYDVIPIYISKKGEWFTGDALLEISAYTPFDESRKGVVRVNLDITAGSGALTRLFIISHEKIIACFTPECKKKVCQRTRKRPALHNPRRSAIINCPKRAKHTAARRFAP